MTTTTKARMRQARPREGVIASPAVALQSTTATRAFIDPTKALPGGRSGLAHARRLHPMASLRKET
ncbi:MAG: hypothetical protein CMI67_16990 [Pelagibaca sp.]|nr:hypothetical protein [Pelagibaca sp.]